MTAPGRRGYTRRPPMNAAEWLARPPGTDPVLVLLGAPIARASISPSQAWRTPAAFRSALARFSTWDGDHGVDLLGLAVEDGGDVEGDEHDPDCGAAHARIEAAVAAAAGRAPVVCVIGGDNSLTLPAMRGIAGGGLGASWGLLTLDAHHDVRPRGADGLPRNGTPVRDLVEAGLPGPRVAQVGLHGFANAREHADWAAAQGIATHSAGTVRRDGVPATLAGALARLAAAGAERLWVDLDLDVLDRAHAPACPASMPGGLSPAELQEAAFRLGRDPRVAGCDLCEVDATADVAGTTVRAAAAAFLAFCAGVAARPR